MNTTSPTSPRINGESIRAEPQGKFTPPWLKPIVIEQVEAITRKFPLDPLVSSSVGHKVHTHIQSIAAHFSRTVPGGLGKWINLAASSADTPQMGRFRSEQINEARHYEAK